MNPNFAEDASVQQFNRRVAFILPGGDLSYYERTLAKGAELMDDIVGGLFIDDDHQADTHIKCPVHFLPADSPFLFQKIENRRY